MVWKKLFGGGGEKEPSPREIERKRQFDRWLDGIGPEWAEAYMILVNDPAIDQAFRAGVHYKLNEGDIEEARKILRQSMHFLTPGSREKLRNVGQAQRWATFDQMAEAGIVISNNATFPMDALQIAKQPVPDRPDLEFPLYFRGEGHLLTVAPTGAGKGQRLILPVLLDFEGPTVVLDPKGENYEHTAWRRSLYGQVFKWAPGVADSDCYNPLERVTGWDDARLLAELLVIPQGKEPFWDEAARDLLTGLIFYVIRTRPEGQRNMRAVCRLLTPSKADFEAMVEDLQGSDDERLKELGNILETQSEALRASISTTLRTQLAIWRSDDVANVTSSTTPGWTVEDILVRDNISVTFAAKTGRAPGWHQREDGGVTRGSAATVYLIVPPEKMAAMRSVLRVMLGQHLSEAIRVRKMIDAVNAEDDSLPAGYPDWPMMFVFDEMPQLGYMRIIEDAVAISRSYRVRLWLFAQDLAQLEEVYPKWRSLVANCRGQIFFRPNDTRTAEHVAERLGRRKDIWGGEDWVASPQQLMGPEFRDDCVIFQDGLSIRANLYPPYFANEKLKEWVAQKKGEFGDRVHRAPRPVLTPEFEPDEDDADLRDDPEYQAELAALQARMRAHKGDTTPEATPKPEDLPAKPPERPSGASESSKRPPTPPGFDE
jgi:type IV secretion system protein VirD4